MAGKYVSDYVGLCPRGSGSSVIFTKTCEVNVVPNILIGNWGVEEKGKGLFVAEQFINVCHYKNE